MTIDQAKREIDEEILKLNGDVERITFYLITLGQRNPGINSLDKTEQTLVKGCHTKTWFKILQKEGKFYFSADSNTVIIRGLASLLVRLFNGQLPGDILQTNLDSFYDNGLRRFMGGHRADGLNTMTQYLKTRIKELATRH